jgi:hypothetical protein
LRARVGEIVERSLSRQPKFRWNLKQAAPAFAMLAAVLVMVRVYHPRSELASTAIQAHKQFVTGMFPLDVRSSSPEVISAWFTERVSFHLKLPPYQEMPELVRPPSSPGWAGGEFPEHPDTSSLR